MWNRPIGSEYNFLNFELINQKGREIWVDQSEARVHSLCGRTTISQNDIILLPKLFDNTWPKRNFPEFYLSCPFVSLFSLNFSEPKVRANSKIFPGPKVSDNVTFFFFEMRTWISSSQTQTQKLWKNTHISASFNGVWTQLHPRVGRLSFGCAKIRTCFFMSVFLNSSKPVWKVELEPVIICC